MPSVIAQDLSKKNKIIFTSYFGYSTRYLKHIFHWTPCKTEILAKK